LLRCSLLLMAMAAPLSRVVAERNIEVK